MKKYIWNFYTHNSYRLVDSESDHICQCDECSFYDEKSCLLRDDKYVIFSVNENNGNISDISRLEYASKINYIRRPWSKCKGLHFILDKIPLSINDIRRLSRSFNVSDEYSFSTHEICNKICNEDVCVFYKEDLSCINSRNKYICMLKLITRGKDCHEDDYW